MSILYLVATPIGNLSDISERAVKTLQDVDFIAAEDTRVTRKLTAHFGVKKPIISYRTHNMIDAGEKILARVKAGESCALVTDAGTPAISDPGGDLVRLFTQSGVPVIIIPGPCAAIAALAVSGLPSGRFVFEGFLPSSSGKRRTALSRLKHEQRTMVFYEAPHRLPGTLSDMFDVFGDRNISISREITKIHEETMRFKLSGAIEHFTATPPRGEFVLVVEGSVDENDGQDDIAQAIELVRLLTESGISTRDAVKKAALLTGCSKSKLYEAVTSAN